MTSIRVFKVSARVIYEDESVKIDNNQTYKVVAENDEIARKKVIDYVTVEFKNRNSKMINNHLEIPYCQIWLDTEVSMKEPVERCYE